MSNLQKMENLPGASRKEGLRVAFDRRVKREFHGSRVTCDAGLLAYPELDEALDLTAWRQNCSTIGGRAKTPNIQW